MDERSIFSVSLNLNETRQVESWHSFSVARTKKFRQSRPLFRLFSSFSHSTITVSISPIKIEKSIDGVLGIWTRGRRMECSDETMELRRPSLTPNKSWTFYDKNSVQVTVDWLLIVGFEPTDSVTCWFF